ncbi:autotransporter outer membrane beta-barrel domain-containing protein [Phascolarctobacterium sp.]
MQEGRKQFEKHLQTAGRRKALAGKVMQTLVCASIACVCISGGDNSAWAADYNSDQTLEVTGNVTETYDNITINKANSDGNFAGINLHAAGATPEIILNNKIDITITDDQDGTTHTYYGIYNYSGNLNYSSQPGTTEGVNITITSNAETADGNANKYGIYNMTGYLVDFGKESTFTIDTKLGNVYGFYLPEAYGDNRFKGQNLTININQNIADTQSSIASGYYSEPNANTQTIDGIAKPFDFDAVTFNVKAVDEASGMYVKTGVDEKNRDQGNNKFNIAGKLTINAQATAGKALGVKTVDSGCRGINSKLTADVADVTVIGKDSAVGFDIGSKFDVEIGTGLTIDATAANSAVGMQMGGCAAIGDTNIFKSSGVNTIKATATEGTAKGIYVFTGIGDEYNNPCYGSSSVDMGDGTVNVEAVGKTDAYGIEIGGPSYSDGKFGDAVVTAAAATGDAYGVYSHAKATGVEFKEGLKVNSVAENGTAYALKADDGSEIKTSKNTAAAVQLTGDLSVQNAGKINIWLNTADSFLSGSSKKDANTSSKINLAFGDGAKWNMTGGSQVNDLTVGKGTVIDMSGDKGANSTLSVDNLKGSGADFIMDVNKDGHDALLVKGTSADGDHSVSLNVNGIKALKKLAESKEAFISTDNANTTFTVADGFSGGLYEYSAELQSKVDADGKTQWYVANAKSRISDNVLALTDANQVAYTAWIDGNGTLRQRLGELQNGADNGVWARMFGGKLGGDEFTNKYKTYQLGYDAQAGDWRLGAAYEYSDGSLDYTSGSGKNKIGAVSLYGTLQGKDNSAVDIVIKRGRIYGDMDIYGKYSDKGDYSTDATSIGVEYTKRFDGGNNVYFEPQAQLTFGRIDGYDYVSTKGVRVAYDDINSLIGRLGIVAGKAFDNGNAYVKASVLHEFSGDSSMTMLAANGDSYQADKSYGDTWLEVGIGGNITLGKNCELYGDVERSFGGDVTKNWGANIGFRYSF